jgi:hypothetical protein
MPKNKQSKPKMTPEEIAMRKAEAAKRAIYKSVDPFMKRLQIAVNDDMPHLYFITDDNCSPEELMSRMKTVLMLSSSSSAIKDYCNDKVVNMTLLLISKCEPKVKPQNEDDIMPSYVSVCLYVPPSIKLYSETNEEIDNSMVFTETISSFTSDVSVTDENITACDFSTYSSIKSADIVVSNFLNTVIKYRIYVPPEDDDDEDDFGAMLENSGIVW